MYFTDLSTSIETQVTTSVSGAQRLNDVSGTRIVYTDLTSPNRRIFLYDISTGLSSQVGSGTVDQNPRIDGQIVVFERGLGAAADVYAVNLATMEEIPVATDTNVDVNPVVSGTRILYERHATTSSDGQIVLFDLTTLTSTPLSSALLNDARRPDIDGDLVVWDVRSPSGDGYGDTDIAIHNLATHTTQVLLRPGNQRSPHISGRFVSFDDDASGNPDIMLYHVDSGQFFAVTTEPGSDFLNDISGNRVAFTSNRAGNNDIWVYEFHVQPALQVTPPALHFGSVNTGSFQSQIPAIYLTQVARRGPLHLVVC